jgi:hypothetical protein
MERARMAELHVVESHVEQVLRCHDRPELHEFKRADLTANKYVHKDGSEMTADEIATLNRGECPLCPPSK